ncbi:glutathione S-transferase kappa 1 isoform X2 [Astyanax mexicanus]|uniref:glutathione S-transferase kappa 1 isoform X2 n=1 Tax=Astyanax mexicanus TaxID=7994 RepID=UPI0020CB3FF5|nr:glutathione S-transferase kappa 1 isoform X2 [Astyanax mexicanus]
MQMSSSRKVVELFYDVVSPYSWLGFEVLCRYRNVWNIELRLRPSLLGGVMKESGNRPPAMVPNKAVYMQSDLNRLAKYFSVPVCFPENPFEVMFEKGSLNAMRFLTAVSEKEISGDVMLERVSREIWKRIWSNDQDITLPESLSEAGLKAGLSASEVEELLQLYKSQPVKDRLKHTTEEAVKHMAFGFPLTVCHVDGKAEAFFGSDRFELLAHCIGEKWLGPQPDEQTAKI